MKQLDDGQLFMHMLCPCVCVFVCVCVCVVSVEICAAPHCKHCADRNVMSLYCVTQRVMPICACGLLCFVPLL
jgi:hypothetical protein